MFVPRRWPSVVTEGWVGGWVARERNEPRQRDAKGNNTKKVEQSDNYAAH